MSFGNPSELYTKMGQALTENNIKRTNISKLEGNRANSERKISLLPSMAINISVTTCDACAADHVVRFTTPSPSVFAYCKQSKTGAGEGLGTRLGLE